MSKDIKLWPVGTFFDFALLMKSTLLSTVYSDLFSGENNLARYLASWYDAVAKLDIIGRIGRSSIVSVGVSLCFLAVP